MKEKQIQLQIEMIKEKIERLNLQKEFYEKLVSPRSRDNKEE